MKDLYQILGEDAPEEEDPYERGFADKLYEDYEDDPELPPQAAGPVIRAYNADFRQGRQPERHISDETMYQPLYDQQPFQTSRAGRAAAQQPVRQKSKQRYQTLPEEEEEPGRKPKKKRRVLRFFLKLLLVLLALFVIVIGVMLLLAKQPVSEEALGARRDGCSTILLAGTDESGDRTDTVMLLSVDRSNKRISLMSIPRDTKVNSSYSPHKINLAYGVNGKDEDGMEALLDYVSDLVGFRPDGYVLIDLDVFVDLVDLMGGVDFDVPCDMFYTDPSQDLYIDLKAGLQELDGQQAMGLVRFRSGYAMADLQRVNVQRDFILSALSQWISLKNLWKMPSAARLVSAHTTTDLTTRNLVWLAMSVAVCGTDDMQMTTIPYNMSGDGMYVLVDPYETADVVNAYFNPYEKEITVDDLYPGV